jgi:hypothetical protein
MRARNWPFWSAERRRAAAQRKCGVGPAVAALPLEAGCLDDTGHLLELSSGLVQRTSIALRCGKRPKRWRMLPCLSAWARSVSSRLGICPISDFRKEPHSRNLRGPPHQAKRGVRTMSQSGFETPEQVLRFDPKAKGRSDVNPLDDAGQAIVAQIRAAADLANQDCDRAMSLAHKLSMELRAAEDRTHELRAEVELWRTRATRAEEWLRTIQKEVEDKLIVRRPLSGVEETTLQQ